jgi:peptidyl-prolyl cis-trans isomerase A (cyclophilin A)
MAFSGMAEGIAAIEAWREAIYATNRPRVRMELAAARLLEIDPNPDEEVVMLCFRVLDRVFKEHKMGFSHRLAKSVEAHLKRNDLLDESNAESLELTIGLSAVYINETELASKFVTDFRHLVADLSKNERDMLDQLEYEHEVWQLELQQRKLDLELDLPRVLLKTDIGDVEIELFSNTSPVTVEKFIGLVESGFYDGTVFDAVFAGRVAQGGVFGTDGNPRSTNVTFPREFEVPSSRRHFYGYVCLIPNSTPGRPNSAFAILKQPIAPLDGSQTVFGRVVSGMEIVEEFETTLQFDDEEKVEEISGASPNVLIKAEMIRGPQVSSPPSGQNPNP